MKKIFLTSRILLGLIFFVFGLNFFYNFIPMPPPDENMRKLMEGVLAISYLMPVVKTLEVISGLLLLTGLFVPLALLLLAPIVVNICIIHFVYAPAGAPMAIAIVVMMLLQAYAFKGKFLPLLKIKN